MPKSSLMLCKKTPDSSSSEAARELLRHFAFFVGETTGKKIVPSPGLFDIWASTLQDLTDEQIHAAGERLMKTWHFPNLPMPGDVRAQIDGAAGKGFELEAEGEWHKLLSWIQANYYPDVGIRRGAPQLAPALAHAARAAGGFHLIEGCSEADLVWRKKEFLAAYKRVHETGQVEHLLGDGEAKRILSAIARALRPSSSWPCLSLKRQIRRAAMRFAASCTPSPG